jgi:hypothetical protein
MIRFDLSWSHQYVDITRKRIGIYIYYTMYLLRVQIRHRRACIRRDHIQRRTVPSQVFPTIEFTGPFGHLEDAGIVLIRNVSLVQ